MASVSIGLSADFECPTCGEDSHTDPGIVPGKTAVCEHCGRTHRVASVGYEQKDWNKRNRTLAKKRNPQGF